MQYIGACDVLNLDLAVLMWFKTFCTRIQHCMLHTCGRMSKQI